MHSATTPRFGRRLAATMGTLTLVLAACQGEDAGSSGGSDGGAAAGNYPDHEITIIVPFSAGGPTDQVARQLAARSEIRSAVSASGRAAKNSLSVKFCLVRRSPTWRRRRRSAPALPRVEG